MLIFPLPYIIIKSAKPAPAGEQKADSADDILEYTDVPVGECPADVQKRACGMQN